MFVSMSASTLDTTQLEAFAGLEDEGGDLIPQIVSMFVADTDKSLADATDAVSGANVSSLRWIAHNLVGSCGTVGAARMRALASELEATLALGQLQAAGPSVQMLVEEFGQVRTLLGQFASAHTQQQS